MGWIRLQFVRHCISLKGTCLFTSEKKTDHNIVTVKFLLFYDLFFKHVPYNIGDSKQTTIKYIYGIFYNIMKQFLTSRSQLSLIWECKLLIHVHVM